MSDVKDYPVLDSTNVFVKYLPPELDHAGFYRLFAPFGAIVSSKIMVDQLTSKSLGYGFVRFRSAESAQQCIDEMNGFQIANKRLLCKFANQSLPSTPFTRDSSLLSNQVRSNNIYVKPLLPNTVESDLVDLFTPFGEIVECKVMIDRNTGMSRQIGFVRFSNEDMAAAAIDAMNGQHLTDSSPALIVKFADTKEQKAARYARRSKEPGVNSPSGSSPTPSMPYGFYSPYPYNGSFGYPGFIPYPSYAPAYPAYAQPPWFFSQMLEGPMLIVAPSSPSTTTTNVPSTTSEGDLPSALPDEYEPDHKAAAAAAAAAGGVMEASGLATELA